MAQVLADDGLGRLQARERTQPGELAGRVVEEALVVGDEDSLGRHGVADRRVVALPEVEAERVGVLVPALERQGDLDRMPHTEDEVQVGLEVEPERCGQTEAGVLEAPPIVLPQALEGRDGVVDDGRDPGIIGGLGRERAGGLSQAPPVASRSSSLQATIALFSQKPSGLSSAASMNSSSASPSRCRPDSCRARVIIDVPDRCMPVIATGCRKLPHPRSISTFQDERSP
ncbi:MAG: hypothetical protein U5K30_01970 [Acidimicrobiales bacterium]|nr:hypothetical protein [Acidimicrobiales bacterium]